jgi:hypothetical protein
MAPPNYYLVHFERHVIINQWFDTSNHALYIVEHVHSTNSTNDLLDTVSFGNIQLDAFFYDTVCPSSFYIDTNSIYNGKVLNGNAQNCFESFQSLAYVAGLGQVVNVSGTAYTGSDPVFLDSTYLIYYAKGNEHWGTPYYVADGQVILDFTPIPETCATWNDEFYRVSEQIKTGNKIIFHGHSYVEMIYTSMDYNSNYFTNDSLIGYFRNDTLGRQTLFYYTLSDSSFFAYNDNQIVNGTLCTQVDRVLLNGQWRTQWTYGPGFPFGDPEPRTKYIEGIGGLFGLIPVYHIYNVNYGFYGFGTLTCFSVCGQTIYPSDTSSACPFISEINEITINPITIRLFPTLNNGQFQVDMEDGLNYTLMITDILGREVLCSQISNDRNFISLKNPNAGIYLWRVTDGERVLQTGKFIVVQ